MKNANRSEITDITIIDGKKDNIGWINRILSIYDFDDLKIKPNYFLGKINNNMIGYVAVQGSFYASYYTKEFCEKGTGGFIHIGTGMALSEDISYGDIIVSEGVMNIKKTIDNGLQETLYLEFDKKWIQHITEILKEKKIPNHFGKTITVKDMNFLTGESISSSGLTGYIAADMESGSIASTAKEYDIPVISFYVCSDKIKKDGSISDKKTEKEEESIKEGYDMILDIALNNIPRPH